MLDAEFWDLLKLINMDAVNAEDCASGVAPLTKALASKQASEIQAFHELMSTKLYALDSKVRCDVSCGSGDGFLRKLHQIFKN